MPPVNMQFRSPAPGFTLLEVLLASTMLASMSVLLSVLWMSAGEISKDSRALGRALEAPRAINLLQAQWSERRILASGATSFTLEDHALEFITSHPLLDRHSPLVSARYEIRNHPDRLGHARLVYVESRVTNVTTGEVEPRRASGELTLIDRAKRLSLEWIGSGTRLSTQWMQASERDEEASLSAIRLNGSLDGGPITCVLAGEASPSLSY